MHRRAFTLVELLVVIAIIGILSTIAVVSLSSSRTKARIAAGMQSDTNIFHGLGNDLIANWSFDEPSGTAVNDVSGNGYNATVYGTVNAETRVTGIYGGAMYLDQPTNNIRINGTISIPLNSFTISAWFKTTSTSDQKIFSSNSANHFIQTLVGVLRICTENVCAPLGTRRYNDDEWHFTVVTGDDISIRGYVDGILQVTQTASTAVITSSTNTIGATGGTYGQRFNGSIDEIRLYGSAMTAQAIYNMFVTNKSKFAFVQ